jgi:hypothetical protein
MNNIGKTALALGTVILVTCPAYSAETEMGQYRITGPFNHSNLSIFFIHSDDAGRSENLITLEEAMEDGSIVVHETGNVEELMIENNSDNPVFIHSGDIVKGGRQDRVLRYDLVIMPKSGKIPLPSFCVEGGRWSQRGDEDATRFGRANYMIAGKDIKLAAKGKGSQQEVWSEVSRMQDGLSDAADVSVQADRSRSSLQLTLEHEAVDSLSGQYIDAFSSEINRHDDIVGFAFAVNGKINSADIYRSRILFRRLWPKLIRSAAIEAVSELNADSSASELTVFDIKTWLAQADNAEMSSETVNESTRIFTRQNEFDVSFETFDAKNGSMIHKNILRR